MAYVRPYRDLSAIYTAKAGPFTSKTTRISYVTLGKLPCSKPAAGLLERDANNGMACPDR